MPTWTELELGAHRRPAARCSVDVVLKLRQMLGEVMPAPAQLGRGTSRAADWKAVAGRAARPRLPVPPRSTLRAERMRAVAASAEGLPAVMVNGVTGKMGFSTAEAVVQRGLHLLPVAFSGPSLC